MRALLVFSLATFALGCGSDEAPSIPADDTGASLVEVGDSRAIAGARVDASADSLPDASSDLGTDASADVDAGSCRVDGPYTKETASCSDLVNLGCNVPFERIAADAPAPTGGTILAGSYALVSNRTYAGAGADAGPTFDAGYVKYVQATIRVTVSAFDFVDSHSGSSFDRLSATWTTTGTTLTWNVTCPGPVSYAMTYDATPDSITLHWPPTGALGPELQVYRRVP